MSDRLLFKALQNVSQYIKQIEDLQSQEDTIRKGLNIFKIEQQPSKALQSLEKDVKNLQSVSCVYVVLFLCDLKYCSS